jgi:hypothetical protein
VTAVTRAKEDGPLRALGWTRQDDGVALQMLRHLGKLLHPFDPLKAWSFEPAADPTGKAP